MCYLSARKNLLPICPEQTPLDAIRTDCDPGLVKGDPALGWGLGQSPISANLFGSGSFGTALIGRDAGGVVPPGVY